MWVSIKGFIGNETQYKDKEKLGKKTEKMYWHIKIKSKVVFYLERDKKVKFVKQLFCKHEYLVENREKKRVNHPHVILCLQCTELFQKIKATVTWYLPNYKSKTLCKRYIGKG